MMFSRLWKNIKTFLDGDAIEDVEVHDMSFEINQKVEEKRKEASYQIALAEDVRDEITNTIEEIEANKQLAEKFLKEGDRTQAEQCVRLQVQASNKIPELKDRYRALKKEADTAYQAFLDQKAEATQTETNSATDDAYEAMAAKIQQLLELDEIEYTLAALEAQLESDEANESER